MCNLYQLEAGPDAIRRIFEHAGLPLTFPEGVPNLQSREVRITEKAPIVRRAGTEPATAQLIERRWSWPAPGGKPVYNFRSDGREFGSGRCLILADGFFEFTAPTEPGRKRKDRWLFRRADGGPFAVAGLIRNDAVVGEAFTMLTTPPGPDVEPYHARQIAVLLPDQWPAWLQGERATGLLGPLPRGTLAVTPDQLANAGTRR